LEFDVVREAVMNVARYDALKLSEAMLSGERARLARMLEGLRGEGEAPPRILWILAEEIRAICRVQNGIAAGRPLADVLREARVWGDARQTLVSRAAKKLPRAALLAALEHAAKVDRVVKGVVKGDAWDELLQLGLRFSG
jgi:DNA polymerase-3 subunit delta